MTALPAGVSSPSVIWAPHLQNKLRRSLPIGVFQNRLMLHHRLTVSSTGLTLGCAYGGLHLSAPCIVFERTNKLRRRPYTRHPCPRILLPVCPCQLLATPRRSRSTSPSFSYDSIFISPDDCIRIQCSHSVNNIKKLGFGINSAQLQEPGTSGNMAA